MCSVVPDPEVPPHSPASPAPASPEIPESYASPSVLEAIGGPLSRAEDLARHPLIGWEEGGRDLRERGHLCLFCFVLRVRRKYVTACPFSMYARPRSASGFARVGLQQSAVMYSAGP